MGVSQIRETQKLKYEKLSAGVKRIYGEDLKVRNLETFPKAAIIRFLREDYLRVPYAVSRIEEYEREMRAAEKRRVKK